MSEIKYKKSSNIDRMSFEQDTNKMNESVSEKEGKKWV